MNGFDNMIGGSVPSNINNFNVNVNAIQSEKNILCTNTNIDIMNDSTYGMNITFGMNKKEVLSKLTTILNFSLNRTINKNTDILIQIKTLNITDVKHTTFIKNTMNEIASLFGSSINKVLEDLSIPSDKEILLDIFHLTGITNKSQSDLNKSFTNLSKKLKLETNFRTKSILNLYQSFTNKLTPSFLKRCKDNDFYSCLVKDGYVDRLSNGLYSVLETILVELLNATRYENIRKVYEYKDSILLMLSTAQIQTPKKIEGFIANAIMDVLLKENKIEHFSIFGSLFGTDAPTTVNTVNKSLTELTKNTKIQDSLVNSDRFKKLNEIEKSIDKSSVVKGMAVMMSKASSAVASNNQAAITQMIKNTAALNIGNIMTKGKVKITNIKQKTEVDVSAKMSANQKVQNKIQNEISTTLTNNITNSSQDVAEQVKKSLEEKGRGSVVGDTVNKGIDAIADVAKSGIGAAAGVIGKGVDAAASVANNLVSTAGNVLCAVLGPSTNTNTTNDTTMKSIENQDLNKSVQNLKEQEEVLRDKFKLDQSFKSTKDDTVGQDLESKLSTDNMASCAQDLANSPSINISNLMAGDDVELSDIEQTSVVKAVMECALSQETINEVSNKLTTAYANNIGNMIAHIDKSLDENTKKEMIGDVYAVGVAGASMVAATGEAAAKVTTAAGDAGSKVISAAGDASSKVIDSGAKVVSALGEAGSQMVESGGKAAAAVTSSMMMPFVIGGVLILGLIIFLMFGLGSSAKSAVQGIQGQVYSQGPTPQQMPMMMGPQGVYMGMQPGMETPGMVTPGMTPQMTAPLTDTSALSTTSPTASASPM